MRRRSGRWFHARSCSRRLSARLTGDERQREREGRQDVEVIELHRQVEGVRGHRPDERGGQAPREPRLELARLAQASEEPPEEEREERSAHEARLDEERDVERVRAPVRLTGYELVVHREVVQAEAEQWVGL